MSCDIDCDDGKKLSVGYIPGCDNSGQKKVFSCKFDLRNKGYTVKFGIRRTLKWREKGCDRHYNKWEKKFMYDMLGCLRLQI